MARVVIYGLSIRTDRTDRQNGYTVCKECFTVGKSHLISGTSEVFMARVVIYGLSIRTDRQKGYTVCKECFTFRKSHLISGRGIQFVKGSLRSVKYARFTLAIIGSL